MSIFTKAFNNVPSLEQVAEITPTVSDLGKEAKRAGSSNVGRILFMGVASSGIVIGAGGIPFAIGATIVGSAMAFQATVINFMHREQGGKK